MNKNAESVMPVPTIGGWVLVLIAAVVLLIIMAKSFGFIDFEFLRGVGFG